MIKRYMNELYKEIIRVKRKIDGGHLQYFGHRDFGNAMEYYVVLKDGSYFFISIGSKYIPNIRKKDIAFIGKQVDCNSLDERWGKWVDYVDSDRGRVRYVWNTAIRDLGIYQTNVAIKYKQNPYKEIETGYWD